ncbi:RNA polymerase subunit sigma-70 [Bordetella genomosp. 1]|uniref:RNA polymerase subunit sigma-70 n=1 Tax=Bordetella genomosp. 1 TaxID=1395607 RepID=A0A261RX84_9BORD|nr:RNA polymerase sigma factor [Bordetella genomosp. 1]OZI29272.1 RNA polymerase subunit sigma-70 [Bordetella genomosp. 1]OZI64997.1 RNA polymerase subunit sigma-70 [Bordetella genomosp. 1]
MSDPKHLEILLQDCARGQQSALAEIYRLCAPHLFALATRMLRRSDWAEEVIQDSFVSVWRNAGQYSAQQSQPMTWMTRIVRNRCIDLLRRPDLERPDPDGALEAAWADDAPGPLERLQTGEDGQRLADCMKQLESRQRMAIALSFFDDLSHGDIARRLGTPLGTIKSWVRRGMERLKRCLS